MGSIEKEIISALTESKLMEGGKFYTDKWKVVIDADIEDIVNELNAAGVTINEERLAQHLEEAKAAEKEATDRFIAAVKDAGHPELNLNKRADLLRWFFEILELPVYKAGKSGPSLDAESLEFLATKDDSAQFYADAKSAHSLVNTLTNIQKAVRDGRIYPQHNLNKAASGRFSSSGANGDKLNINGWPKAIRDIFKPADGTVTVSFDYKNMEGAVSANLAGEQEILDDIENDVDTHQKLADILGVERKVAKIVNHGVSYGMTAFGLARKIGCTEEEAEQFIEKYWSQRPKIHNLKQYIIRTARMMGYVSTIGDFHRPSRELTDDQIWSTYIQGSAADLFKNALVKVQKYLKESKAGKVSVIMHDAIICELDADKLEETVAAVKDIMEHIHPSFQLKVDVDIDKW